MGRVPTILDCCSKCGSSLIVNYQGGKIKCVDCGKKGATVSYRFRGLKETGEWFRVLRNQTGNIKIRCPYCKRSQWAYPEKVMAMCAFSNCQHLFSVKKNTVKGGEES
jgi:hypothetical protein